jgi:hypothetical protein
LLNLWKKEEEFSWILLEEGHKAELVGKRRGVEFVLCWDCWGFLEEDHKGWKRRGNESTNTSSTFLDLESLIVRTFEDRVREFIIDFQNSSPSLAV